MRVIPSSGINAPHALPDVRHRGEDPFTRRAEAALLTFSAAVLCVVAWRAYSKASKQAGPLLGQGAQDFGQMLRTHSKTLLFLVAYMVTAPALVVLNKHIMVGEGFACPIFVANFGNLGAALVTQALTRSGVWPMSPQHGGNVDRHVFAKKLLPTSIAAACGLALGTTAYLFTPVPLVQILKAPTVVCTMIVLRVAGLVRLTPLLTVGVVLISAGALMAGYSRVHADAAQSEALASASFAGVLMLFGANMSEAAKVTGLQWVFESHSWPIIDLLTWQSGTMFVIQLTVSIFFEHDQLMNAPSLSGQLLGSCVCSMIMGAIVNFSNFGLTKCIGSLSVKVCCHVRTLLFILFAAFVLHERCSLGEYAGYAVSLVGLVFYEESLSGAKPPQSADPEARSTGHASAQARSGDTDGAHSEGTAEDASSRWFSQDAAETLGYLFVYMAAAALMNVSNKKVSGMVPATLLIVVVQMAIAVAIVLPIELHNLSKATRKDVMRWSFIPLLFSGMLSTSMYCFVEMSMSSVLILRNVLPFLTLAAEKIAWDSPKHVSCALVLSMVLLVGGTMLYGAGELKDVYKGGLALAANCLFTVADRIFQRKLLQGSGFTLSTGVCALLNNSMAIIPICLVALYDGEIWTWRQTLGSMSNPAWLNLILSGFLGCTVCYAALGSQKRVSATTFLMAQNAIKVIVLMAGIVMFADRFNAYKIAGTVISFVGVTWYGYLRLPAEVRETTRRAQEHASEPRKGGSPGAGHHPAANEEAGAGDNEKESKQDHFHILRSGMSVANLALGSPHCSNNNLAHIDQPIKGLGAAPLFCFLSALLIQLNYTILIPSSTAVAHHLGFGDSFAGLAVGIMHAWTLCSLYFYKRAYDACPGSARALQLTAMTLLLLSTTSQFALMSLTSLPFRGPLFLASRSMGGLAAGVMYVNRRVVTEADKGGAPVHMSIFFRIGDIGLASGPLIIGLVTMWLPDMLLTLPLYLMACILAVVIPLVAWFYPAESADMVPPAAAAARPGSNPRRFYGIIALLFVSCVRVFSQSSWEVVSMRQLASAYGLGLSQRSLLIGFIILFTLPTQHFFMRVFDRLPKFAWLVGLLGVTTLCLLIRSTSVSLLSWSLLSIVYMGSIACSATVSDSMAPGMAAGEPPSSPFNVAVVVYWQVFSQNLLGRCLGPWASAAVQASYGFTAYQLMVAGCVFLALVFTSMYAWCLGSLDDKRQEEEEADAGSASPASSPRRLRLRTEGVAPGKTHLDLTWLACIFVLASFVANIIGVGSLRTEGDVTVVPAAMLDSMPAEWAKGKVLRIRDPGHVCHVHAGEPRGSPVGLTQYVRFVLEQVQWAREHDLPYFVSLREDASNVYVDPPGGGTGTPFWESMFEPVASPAPAGTPSGSVIELSSGYIGEADGAACELARRGRWKKYDWSSEAASYGDIRERRLQMVALANGLIRFQPELQAKINERVDAMPRPILGVHARGTDKLPGIVGGIVPAESYYFLIAAFLKEHKDGSVYIASDSQTLLEGIMGEFSYASHRIFMDAEQHRGTTKAVFKDGHTSAKAKRESVLLDIGILSEADWLVLPGGSAVSELAIWLGRDGLVDRAYDLSLPDGPLPPWADEQESADWVDRQVAFRLGKWGSTEFHFPQALLNGSTVPDLHSRAGFPEHEVLDDEAQALLQGYDLERTWLLRFPLGAQRDEVPKPIRLDLRDGEPLEDSSWWRIKFFQDMIKDLQMPSDRDVAMLGCFKSSYSTVGRAGVGGPHGLPVFSFDRHFDDDATILWPYHGYLDKVKWDINDNFGANISQQDSPWETKIEEAIWLGSPASFHSLFTRMEPANGIVDTWESTVQEHPEWLLRPFRGRKASRLLLVLKSLLGDFVREPSDVPVYARFTNYQDFGNSDTLNKALDKLVAMRNLTREQVTAEGISKKELLKYKYHVAMEGSSTATSLPWQLASQSVVFMPFPVYHESILSRGMLPWRHFVPIRPDFSDLREKLAWCKANDAACQRIAQAATKYMQRFYDDAAEMEVRQRVFNAYVQQLPRAAGQRDAAPHSMLLDYPLHHRSWLPAALLERRSAPGVPDIFGDLENIPCDRSFQPKIFDQAGFGAAISSLLKRLAFAAEQGLAIREPRMTHQGNGECSDLGCFFEPMSKCQAFSGELREDEYDLPPNEAQRTAILNETELWSRWSYMEQGAAAIPSKWAGQGQFWWAMQAIAFAMRPNAAMRAAIEKAKAEVSFPQEPIMALHVRHGDTCRNGVGKADTDQTGRESKGRICEGLDTYMLEAQRVADHYGIRHIYLATDSPSVVREATERYGGEFTFHRLEYSREKPDAYLNDLIASKAIDTVAEARNALLDMYLLAECDAFVGKFTSNFDRLAYALMAHRASSDNSLLPPYSSLDSFWCADFKVHGDFGSPHGAFDC